MGPVASLLCASEKNLPPICDGVSTAARLDALFVPLA
jgi:hypothetical protein